MNIVLIDDEEACHMSINLCLFGTNHSLVGFTVPQEGVEYIITNAEAVDMVLLDYMMPEMNGLEVLDMLNQYQVPDRIPIVIQTGSNKLDDIKKCLTKGAYKYLAKPFNRQVLLSLLNEFCNA